MPNEVSVSTAEPGSSARTLAYRAAHRDVSCGPSNNAVETIVGPTARMTSATLSFCARSSQTSETIVTSSLTCRNLAVDDWRPNHFDNGTDAVTNEAVNNIFTGVNADLAVNDSDAWIYRLGYNITLIGRIVFIAPPVIK